MEFPRRLVLCFAIILSGVEASADQVKTVVVISVDGLGAKLLAMSKAPTLTGLGERAPAAETVVPTQTIPAHVSMLSGLTPERHGMYENEHEGNLKRLEAPTIFDLAHAKGLRTAAVFGKEKLEYVFDDGSIDEIYMTKWPLLGDWVSRTETYVYEAASRLLKKKPAPNLVFIHFSLVDSVGHMLKWESAMQRWSVEKVDAAIGRLLGILEKDYEPGSYALIVTADHGGHGGSHGEISADGRLVDRDRDQLIPWIVHGAKLRKDVGVVRVYDTAPTVAALLGLDVPVEWKWEGRSVVE